MNKPVIDEIGINRCTGCFGCYNFCPSNAIKMDYYKEGFLVPVIIRDKCQNCGLCLSICPIYNFTNQNNSNLKIPIVYASWTNNPFIRYISSSGGIFYEIAKYILKRGGIIYGVGWDSNLMVKHIRITKEKDLIKLTGSKYLQSNVGFTFKQAIKDLNANKLVLFSGTPCQIAVLKKYKEEFKNLFLVEVLCHGIPSKLVFDYYIKSKFSKHQIKSINFRDKRYSWNDFVINIKFEGKPEYVKHHSIDEFFFGYLKNFFLNDACYECSFATLPRQGDITLGDFWDPNQKYNQKLGVSLMLVNNKRAYNMIQQISNIKIFKEDLLYAINGNPRINSRKINKPRVRNVIIKDLKKKGFEDILKYYKKSLRKKKRIFFINQYIVRFIPHTIKNKMKFILDLIRKITFRYLLI